jgi:hypothetical protein
MGYKKPKPRPAAARPARDALSKEARALIASKAVYVGSPHHTDIPKLGLQVQPRSGATSIEQAEELGLKNPSCTVCPRKWARRPKDVNALLRSAIEAGNFVEIVPDGMPNVVWARDPDDPSLVYEAKLVSYPSIGYKGYPLTQFQAKYNIPIELP